MADKEDSKLVFDTNYEPPKPSQVIMHILSQASREGKFWIGPVDDEPGYDISVASDIDAYVERLLAKEDN